jgi:hypothetical protein
VDLSSKHAMITFHRCLNICGSVDLMISFGRFMIVKEQVAKPAQRGRFFLYCSAPGKKMNTKMSDLRYLNRIWRNFIVLVFLIIPLASWTQLAYAEFGGTLIAGEDIVILKVK